MDEMIRTLPMIPLRGLTVLPLMIVNFDISRENRSVRWKLQWSRIRRFFL